MSSRGYHGDCRDCVYYKHCYHMSNDGNEDWQKYYCSHSGEWFSDWYGDQCHWFYAIEDLEAEQSRQEHKHDAIKGWLLATAINNLSEKSQEDEENPGQRDSSSGCGLFSFLLVVILLGMAAHFIDSVAGYNENATMYLQDTISSALYDSKFKLDENGEYTLLISIPVKDNLLFSKRECYAIVKTELKQYEEWRSGQGEVYRNNELVVPDLLVHQSMSAYYNEHEYVCGSNSKRVFLLSDNLDSEDARAIRDRCEKIPIF